ADVDLGEPGPTTRLGHGYTTCPPSANGAQTHRPKPTCAPEVSQASLWLGYRGGSRPRSSRPIDTAARDHRSGLGEQSDHRIAHRTQRSASRAAKMEVSFAGAAPVGRPRGHRERVLTCAGSWRLLLPPTGSSTRINASGCWTGSSTAGPTTPGR